MSKAKNLDLGKTSAVMLSAAESHRNEGINYFPKDGSHRYRFPSRKWTTSEKIFATILATGITLYGGHEIAKKNKLTKKYADSFDEFLGGTFSQIYNQIASLPGYGAHPPVVAPVVPAVNASVTPTITPQPIYDYYDEVNVNGTLYKVKIAIKGTTSEKTNIKNLLETWKKVTPEDYNDLIRYAPKKILVGNDGYDSYGLGSDDDITLDKRTEEFGRFNDTIAKLNGVAGLRAETLNSKRFKTGVSFNSKYDLEMASNKGRVEYLVMTGVWTQKQADDWMKNISEQLKNGTFFNPR